MPLRRNGGSSDLGNPQVYLELQQEADGLDQAFHVQEPTV